MQDVETQKEKEMKDARMKFIYKEMEDAQEQIINDSGNEAECVMRSRLKFLELKRKTARPFLEEMKVEGEMQMLENMLAVSFAYLFNETLQQSIFNFKSDVGKKCEAAMIEIMKTDGMNNFEPTLRNKCREFVNEFRVGKEFFGEVFETQLKELIDDQAQSFHSKNMSGNVDVLQEFFGEKLQKLKMDRPFERLEDTKSSVVDVALASEQGKRKKSTSEQVVVENLNNSQVCDSCKKIHLTKQDVLDQSRNKSTDVTSEEILSHSKDLSPESLILFEEDLNVSEKELISSKIEEDHIKSNMEQSHHSSKSSSTVDPRPYNSNAYSNRARYYSSRHDSSRTIIFYTMIGLIVFGSLILYIMKSCCRRNAVATTVPQESTGSQTIIVADEKDTIHMVRV